MNKHTISAFLLASSVLSAAAYADGHNKDDKKHGHKNHGAKHFSMIDENDDGKLSKEEMLNFHERHFTKMDADGDGFISKEEMKAKYKDKKKHNKKKKSKESDDE